MNYNNLKVLQKIWIVNLEELLYQIQNLLNLSIIALQGKNPLLQKKTINPKLVLIRTYFILLVMFQLMENYMN